MNAINSDLFQCWKHMDCQWLLSRGSKVLFMTYFTCDFSQNVLIITLWMFMLWFRKERNKPWVVWKRALGYKDTFERAACTVCYYPFDIFEYILEWSMKSAVMSSLWAITAAPFLWVFQRCLIASFLQLFRGGGSNLAGSLSPQNNTRHNGKDCAGKCCFFQDLSPKYSRSLLLWRNWSIFPFIRLTPQGGPM